MTTHSTTGTTGTHALTLLTALSEGGKLVFSTAEVREAAAGPGIPSTSGLITVKTRCAGLSVNASWLGSVLTLHAPDRPSRTAKGTNVHPQPEGQTLRSR